MTGRGEKRYVLVILSAVMALGFIAAFIVLRNQTNQAAEQLARVRLEQKALVDEIVELEEEISYTQSIEYIMQAARDHLGMIFPGEIRYMMGGN